MVKAALNTIVKPDWKSAANFNRQGKEVVEISIDSTITLKMKRHSLMLFTLLFSVFITNAQNLKPNLTIKVKRATFITTELDHNSMSVLNSNNIYHKKIPKDRNPDMVFEMKDKSGLLNAFTQVFTDGRLKQLLPERRMMMTFYINPSGEIMEISFVLNKNTLVTGQEVEDLEKAIKADVSFKFRSKEIKGQDFIDIGFIVTYSKVLDRTFK